MRHTEVNEEHYEGNVRQPGGSMRCPGEMLNALSIFELKVGSNTNGVSHGTPKAQPSRERRINDGARNLNHDRGCCWFKLVGGRPALNKEEKEFVLKVRPWRPLLEVGHCDDDVLPIGVMLTARLNQSLGELEQVLLSTASMGDLETFSESGKGREGQTVK
jgi:hypothetical protein